MASTQQIHAMKEANIGIAAICIAKSYVVFDNGIKLPITSWLDENHERTDDLCEVRFFEFGDDEVGTGCMSFDEYEMPSFMDH
jgi:hypothetical protein